MSFCVRSLHAIYIGNSRIKVNDIHLTYAHTAKGINAIVSQSQSHFTHRNFMLQVHLRDALQTRFSMTFTDGCWDAFVASPFIRVVPSPAGDKELYIAYNDFLSKFDVMIR